MKRLIRILAVVTVGMSVHWSAMAQVEGGGKPSHA